MRKITYKEWKNAFRQQLNKKWTHQKAMKGDAACLGWINQIASK